MKDLNSLNKKEQIKIEQGLLKKLDERCGQIIRRVLHERYDKPRIKTVSLKDIRYIIGVTTVELYDAGALIFEKGKGSNYNDVRPMSVGVAYCSAEEHSFDTPPNEFGGFLLPIPYDVLAPS